VKAFVTAAATAVLLPSIAGCGTSDRELATTRALATTPPTRGADAVRRRDGRLQVTYAGHPLYYYVGDRRAGEVLCQGVAEFGGTWYVVAPDGHVIH
jgi:hypothetical protein